MHSNRHVPISIPLALILAVAACDGSGPGGDGGPAEPDTASLPTPEQRLDVWEEERPGEPIRVSLAFDSARTDSTVAVLLDNYALTPYAAYIEVAGLVTRHRVPPEEASLRFLHTLKNQVRTGLEVSLCAQPDRAAAMLAEDSVSLERARAVLLEVERSLEARTRMAEAGARYIYGVEVTGMVESVRELLVLPELGFVEPAALVDGRVIVPEPRLPEATGLTGDSIGSAAGPEVAGEGGDEEGSAGRPSPDRETVLVRLRRLAEGLEGCGPSDPPAAGQEGGGLPPQPVGGVSGR